MKIEEEKDVTLFLVRNGITPSLTGYDYISKALEYIIDNDLRVRGNLSSTILPYLSEEFGKSPQSIERVIRHSINCAYETGSLSHPILIGCRKEKPTVVSFLSLVKFILNTEYRIPEGGNS